MEILAFTLSLCVGANGVALIIFGDIHKSHYLEKVGLFLIALGVCLSCVALLNVWD